MILAALALAVTAGLIYICACHRRRPALAQCGAVVILVFYLVLVFASAVFGREPGKAYRYELTLFWSYREIMAGRTKLIAENFWNVMMLLPIGALLPTAYAKMKLSSVTAAAFAVSLTIELTQLITKRGLFEFDDMFHNTLGAIIGYGVYQLIRTLHNITD